LCNLCYLAHSTTVCFCYNIWRNSADGVEAAAAQTSYSKKVAPVAPCGRYGATAVVYNQQLWLFGGTDGGFSKKHTSKSKSGKKPNSRLTMPS